MTQTDPFSSMTGKDVPDEHVANALGSLLSAMMTDNGQTAVGPLQSSGTIGTASATPITPTQTAATNDAISQQTTTTGDTADPVPQGTGVSQPYGGQGGHPGVDLTVPVGTTIVSAISGTVINASNSDPNGYGNMVEVMGANGISTRYGHLSSIGVKVGDKVKAGQPIGKSGGEKGADGSGNSDGPHLHFEVDQNGKTLDPMPYLAGGAQILGGSAGSTGATVPSRTISPQDATDTGLARLTGSLTGNDPGSENLVTQVPVNTSSTGPTNGPQQGTTGTATKGQDTDPGAIDAFLNSVKQHESGGDYTARNTSGLSNAAGAYQFIGSTWKGEGGSTASAADATPAEQDAIARKMATDLFNQFHSWRLVAIAWYGGPGVAEQVAQGVDPGSPESQGSYLEYGDTIARMMAGTK